MVSTLVIKLWNHCNCRCCYCRNDPDVDNVPSKQEVRRRLDLAIDMLDCPVRAVLTGGEPSIYPDIIKVMGWLRAAGFTCIELQSNARVLSDSRLTCQMVNAGMTHLFASVAGYPEETHASVTGVEGAFAETVRGIQNALGTVSDVEVNYVVSNETITGLLGFAKWVPVSLKGVRIRLSVCCSKGRAIAHGSAPHLREAVPPMIEAAKYLAREGVDVMTQYIPLCMMGNMYYAAVEGQGVSTKVVLCDLRDREALVWEGGARQYFSECEGCLAQRMCPGVAHRSKAGSADVELLRPFVESGGFEISGERQWKHV